MTEQQEADIDKFVGRILTAKKLEGTDLTEVQWFLEKHIEELKAYYMEVWGQEQ